MTPEQEQAIWTIYDLIRTRLKSELLPSEIERDERDLPARVAQLLPGLSRDFIQRAIALSEKNEGARIVDEFRVAIAAAHQAFSASPDEEAQP